MLSVLILSILSIWFDFFLWVVRYGCSYFIRIFELLLLWFFFWFWRLVFWYVLRLFRVWIFVLIVVIFVLLFLVSVCFFFFLRRWCLLMRVFVDFLVMDFGWCWRMGGWLVVKFFCGCFFLSVMVCKWIVWLLYCFLRELKLGRWGGFVGNFLKVFKVYYFVYFIGSFKFGVWLIIYFFFYKRVG